MIRDDNSEENDERTPLIMGQEGRRGLKGIPTRWILVLMAFLGFANVYAMRVNLSVALIAMVNKTALHPPKPGPTDHDTFSCPLPVPPTNTSGNGSEDGPFDWDEKTQGYVLSSFFYGYVLTQFPAGHLAQTLGGKWIYGLGILITAFFTILTPWAAYTNFYLLIILRILEGMAEGVTFPVMHSMLAKWAPPSERSRMVTFSYMGAQVGTFVSLPLSGILCDSYGWESVFYVFGGLGFVWFAFYVFLVYDNPHKHPRISPDERRFIEESINHGSNIDAKPEKTPWVSIFTSINVWAIVFAHIGYNYGMYTLLLDLPTYMENILHFDIKSDAILSSLPYCFTVPLGIGASYIADQCIIKGIMSVSVTRKLFNSLGTFIPAISLIALGYAGCNHFIVMGLLFITIGIGGVTSAGYQVNHIDIAPNFAGTLMGITNTFSNLTGFIAPSVVGFIINNHDDFVHWRIVFVISAIIISIGNVIFISFSSGQEQEWNSNQSVSNRSDDVEENQTEE